MDIKDYETKIEIFQVVNEIRQVLINPVNSYYTFKDSEHNTTLNNKISPQINYLTQVSNVTITPITKLQLLAIYETNKFKEVKILNYWLRIMDVYYNSQFE